MESEKAILCIEDDEDACELLTYVFELIGWKVVVASTAEEGIEQAQTKKFAAIVLDYRIADSDGITVCINIRNFDQKTPIIFFTAEAKEKVRQTALAVGANKYLIKPNDFEILTKTVLEQAQQAKTVQEI